MSDKVKVIFKNGETREFIYGGRHGGSYSIRVKYEGAFVVITDEWDKKTAFPADDVKEITEESFRSGW